MSDSLDQAGTTYAVPPEVWRKAEIAGTVGVVAGVLLLAVSFVGYAAAPTDGKVVGLAGMGVGFLVAAYSGVVVWASIRARGVRFALTVAPAGLVIDSAGSHTTIPWDAVEHLETVAEGPQKLTLEARLRPDAHLDLPQGHGLRKPALPQPCPNHPGNLRLFILTLLGSRLAECLNDIEEYVPIRAHAEGQAGS